MEKKKLAKSWKWILLFIILLILGLMVLYIFSNSMIIEPTYKYIDFADYSCSNGIAKIIIFNAYPSVSEIIDFGASCEGSFPGTVAICRDVNIVKNLNFEVAPTISPTSIAPGKTATLTDNCGINNICSYRFTNTPNTPSNYYSWQNTATVTVDC
jgi:hypothetical protein